MNELISDPSYIVTLEDFKNDRLGKKYPDIYGMSGDDGESAIKGEFDFQKVIDFFNDPKKIRRMEESEIHHDRPALAGVVRDFEKLVFIDNYFVKNDPPSTIRLKQAVGILVKLHMEKRGWKKKGEKGIIGTRIVDPEKKTREKILYFDFDYGPQFPLAKILLGKKHVSYEPVLNKLKEKIDNLKMEGRIVDIGDLSKWKKLKNQIDRVNREGKIVNVRILTELERDKVNTWKTWPKIKLSDIFDLSGLEVQYLPEYVEVNRNIDFTGRFIDAEDFSECEELKGHIGKLKGKGKTATDDVLFYTSWLNWLFKLVEKEYEFFPIQYLKTYEKLKLLDKIGEGKKVVEYSIHTAYAKIIGEEIKKKNIKKPPLLNNIYVQEIKNEYENLKREGKIVNIEGLSAYREWKEQIAILKKEDKFVDVYDLPEWKDMEKLIDKVKGKNISGLSNWFKSSERYIPLSKIQDD